MIRDTVAATRLVLSWAAAATAEVLSTASAAYEALSARLDPGPDPAWRAAVDAHFGTADFDSAAAIIAAAPKVPCTCGTPEYAEHMLPCPRWTPDPVA